MSNLLQIVILSRDRPIFFTKALDSLIHQNISDISYEIIISDNSEADDVNNLFQENYASNKKITYKRRNPTISSRSHYELVIEEFSSKYSMIFHDDDILHPNYLAIIAPIISDQSFSAIGCNAWIFKNEINDSFKKMHDFKHIKKFTTKKDFLTQYLVGNGGVAPFPGYIYKSKFLKKISFAKILTGKHADAAMLAYLIDFEPIIWTPDVLMYYRIHNNSDSAIEIIPDRLKLLRYMYSEGVKKSAKSVFLFKYFYWFNWFKQKDPTIKNIFNWRYRIVFKFIFFGGFRFIFSSYFWSVIFKRIKMYKKITL